jgi:siroheme decarboxylase
MTTLPKIPKKVLFALTEKFAIVPEPYAEPARRLGISQKKLLGLIAAYQKQGIIRRMGIVYGHFKVGYTANALVVWKVDGSLIEKMGALFTQVQAVTHCYARQAYPQWPYTLYTMVHAKTKKDCNSIIGSMAKSSGIKDYKILGTLKEFKKIKTDLREIL